MFKWLDEFENELRMKHPIAFTLAEMIMFPSAVALLIFMIIVFCEPTQW